MLRRNRPPTAIETAILRNATLAIALTWPLWQAGALTSHFTVESFFSHWYPMATAVLFALANVLVAAAAVIGRRDLLILSLRLSAASLPVALALFIIQTLVDGAPAASGMWFTIFSALPAIAFALTVPLAPGITGFFLLVGGTTLAAAALEHRSDPLGVATEVGLALVYSLPLVLIVCATLQLARFIDAAGNKSHAENIAATRARARAEETTRFTALVHDNVLSTLSGLSQGIFPTEPVGLRLTPVFDEAGDMSTDQFIEAVTTTIRQHTPDCIITADESTSLTLPGVAGANITMAIAEMAKNSRQHAGPDVRRYCHVSLSDSALHLRYTDEGPGFLTEDVRPTAAGIRISILGRMEATDGGSATVTSSPGHGTTVDLAWKDVRSAGSSAENLPPGPAPHRNIRASRFNSAAMRNYDLMHLSYVFGVPYGVAVAAIFLLLNVINGHSTSPANLVTTVLAVALVAVIVSGRAYRVAVSRAWVVGAGVVLLMEAGRWQDLSAAPEWSHDWHITAASLLCALLALRGRPVSALLTLVAGAVAIEVMSVLPGTPDRSLEAVQVLLSSLLVVACALLTLGIRYILVRLPEARQKLRESELRVIAAEEATIYRQDRLQLLREELAPLVEATTGLTAIDHGLKDLARLTELRMRDAMRSPLLDLPDVRTAAWDARGRGVTVQLIDDRSSAEAPAGTVDAATVSPIVPRPIEALHDGMVRRILDVLSQADTGTVTVRLLPRGRSAFATISDDDGIHRYHCDGSLQQTQDETVPGR
ncbi:hypothetical protein ACT3SZ_01315 [Corynebacterium sp. AOP40-9SA-29]|uniref:hypothetical protein n=1 Tax=Corynebacterium sp. AOP40-9SA-29 TaxID=3457677 RepID=UPI0040338BC4